MESIPNWAVHEMPLHDGGKDDKSWSWASVYSVSESALSPAYMKRVRYELLFGKLFSSFSQRWRLTFQARLSVRMVTEPFNNG